MATYQKIKGTQDFYDLSARKLSYIENFASDIASNYGCKHIITPIFEGTEVFVKNVGEDSDVVTKEMYTFLDKGKRSITLRPEGTAAVARSFIENKMYANPGLTKYFYYGPMFRYERPQVGRYREFNQFGIEVYGNASYLLDVDVILAAYNIFSGLGIKNVTIKVNSIGNFESRQNYSKALKAYFEKYVDTMCEDCKRRINTNPMRILDCKVDKDHEALKNVPSINDYLTLESKEYFENVTKALDAFNVPYIVDYNLVRGLDYYTDTVFEFIINSDDELNGLALGGGGKYASMISSMCGVDVPGIGFAFGLERISAVMDKQNVWEGKLKESNAVVIMGLDEESKLESLKLADDLRKNGIEAQIDYNSCTMKAQFKLADRLQAKYIVIIGEEERISGIYTVKNTVLKTQEKIEKKEIINYLRG